MILYNRNPYHKCWLTVMSDIRSHICSDHSTYNYFYKNFLNSDSCSSVQHVCWRRVGIMLQWEEHFSRYTDFRLCIRKLHLCHHSEWCILAIGIKMNLSSRIWKMNKFVCHPERMLCICTYRNVRKYNISTVKKWLDGKIDMSNI